MSVALFEPLTLRGMTFRNRIWLAPMCQYSCERRDGVPTAWHFTHLASRAVGGFGLILTEAAAVSPEGRISPQDAGIWNDAQADSWRWIVNEVHAQSGKIGIQLAHAGRKASTYRPFIGEPNGSIPVEDAGWETIGPSPIAFEGYRAPREMTQADIANVISQFVAAAKHAHDANFDVVEIHAAHGYLLHSFLSPASNTRDDEYGGCLTNRARLLLEVVHAVRAVWPKEKPLFVRISATDWSPTGWDVEAAIEVCRMLKAANVDLVDVSSGGNVMADIPVRPGYQVEFARAIRERVGIKTSAVGLITEPTQAEAILKDGDADAVAVARAGLREPYWPLRAAHELGLNWREAPYPAQYTRGAW